MKCKHLELKGFKCEVVAQRDYYKKMEAQHLKSMEIDLEDRCKLDADNVDLKRKLDYATDEVKRLNGEVRELKESDKNHLRISTDNFKIASEIMAERNQLQEEITVLNQKVSEILEDNCKLEKQLDELKHKYESLELGDKFLEGKYSRCLDLRDKFKNQRDDNLEIATTATLALSRTGKLLKYEQQKSVKLLEALKSLRTMLIEDGYQGINIIIITIDKAIAEMEAK